MLESMRSAAGTWVAKLLLLLLVVSFAIWGISGRMLNQFGGDKVVTAGGTSVSGVEYRLAYDRQLNVMSQQFGQRLTRDQANALGIDNQVLSQLVAGAVLDEQARKLGLGLSKDRLAQLTWDDPTFRGPDGQFDRQAFEYILRQIGMRPEDYLKNRAQVAVRQQIVEAVSDGLVAPDTFLRAVALYRGEDRTIDYLPLPKSLVEPIAAPSDEVLKAWFEENKKNYAAPEFRKLSYVKLEPEDIMDVASITDEQVRQDYDKNKSHFTTAETRKIDQLVLANAEAAKAASDAIKAGATFDKVVADQGKTAADVTLGTLTKEQIADKAVAEAAFALQANQVSDVVQGAFGPVLVRVSEITPQTVKTLDEVKDQIRKELALAEANRILLDVHDSYEDARAGGDTMQAAADKLKLKVVTIDAIDRAGQDAEGTVISTLPDSRNLIQAAFEAEAGAENPPLNLGSNGFVFYEVVDVTPARDRTLDEVRAKVVADWTAAEATKRLQDKANELEKRLKDGTALDVIAGELKLEKQTKRGLKRETDDADFGREGAAAMFAMGQGGTGVIAAPAGDAQILFKVAEVFEPAGADKSAVPEDAQKTFASGMSDDLLDQLVAQLQGEYQATIDREAITRALAVGTP
ncbi:peptidylprolyl isomerase [Aminobacter sp. AP02]|uniref:peptidylprolyl isomerase n=1 Tax=Aminobacter sp. AP02 TaxID=2135737 RepID=UPI000D6CEFD7|nr:peptidylprolyl isomerase [Aminobacter sp. AP02]PWK69778.1 peptidyl-prolyl cis-trans isomerase D [Aminobacter sp. AP02]